VSPHVALFPDRHRFWHGSVSEVMALFRENISLQAIDKPLSRGLG
jgi:hypothetical protein